MVPARRWVQAELAAALICAVEKKVLPQVVERLTISLKGMAEAATAMTETRTTESCILAFGRGEC